MVRLVRLLHILTLFVRKELDLRGGQDRLAVTHKILIVLLHHLRRLALGEPLPRLVYLGHRQVYPKLNCRTLYVFLYLPFGELTPSRNSVQPFVIPLVLLA